MKSLCPDLWRRIGRFADHVTLARFGATTKYLHAWAASDETIWEDALLADSLFYIRFNPFTRRESSLFAFMDGPGVADSIEFRRLAEKTRHLQDEVIYLTNDEQLQILYDVRADQPIGGVLLSHAYMYLYEEADVSEYRYECRRCIFEDRWPLEGTLQERRATELAERSVAYDYFESHLCHL